MARTTRKIDIRHEEDVEDIHVRDVDKKHGVAKVDDGNAVHCLNDNGEQVYDSAQKRMLKREEHRHERHTAPTEE